MMRVLIDTNIILDIAFKRHPFYKDAVKVEVFSPSDFIKYLDSLS
jgi:ribosomal protein L31